MAGKGVAIISEAILAIGVIVVSALFVMVSGDIIDFQTSSVQASNQQQILEGISHRIDVLDGYGTSSSTTYETGSTSYTLAASIHTLSVRKDGETVASKTFTSHNLEPVTIRNAKKLCIGLDGEEVSIEQGACDRDTTDLCANGRCKGNGDCEIEQGETCKSDCQCPTEDGDTPDYASEAANYTCLPEYTSTTQIGCVTDAKTWTQSKGDSCDYNFECKKSLTCTDDKTGNGKHCCPDGEAWNGDQCIDSQIFDIVYVPVNYDSSDLSDYQSDSDKFHQAFIERSPFSTCTNPDNHATKHVAQDIESVCGIDASEADGNWGYEFGSRETWSGKWEDVRDCANKIYGGNEWDYLHAICEEGERCSNPGLGGKAAWIGTPASFTDQKSSQTLGLEPARVGAHEIGHTLDLRHVEPSDSNTCILTAGCDTSNPAGTPSPPNTPDDCETGQTPDYTLSYCQNSNQYGNAAYDYLKNSKLDPYLGESCS